MSLWGRISTSERWYEQQRWALTACTVEYTTTVLDTAYNKRVDQCCNCLNGQCLAYGSKLPEVVKATSWRPSYLDIIIIVIIIIIIILFFF